MATMIKRDGASGNLVDIAKKLMTPNMNKESILQHLKAANTVLMDVQQSASQATSGGIKACAEALAQKHILHHKDKEVRLFVASCLSDILRVAAPQAPYEDPVLKEIFQLFVSIFHGLGDIESPSFSRRVTILESLAKVRICVVMLDLDCDDLILELFNTFFETVSPEHPRTLTTAMTGVMAILLEDREDIPQVLLDSILSNLLKQRREESPAAYNLACQLLETCTGVLQPYVQRFLLSVIVDRKAGESELVGEFHELIYEIYRVVPQMLITVLPNLKQEVEVDQVDKRLDAVRLLAKLFAMPGKNVAIEYRQLFSDFVKRLLDKDMEVRLEMLKLAKSVVMALPPSGSESAEVLTAINARLMDYEEKVRSGAMSVLCELAIAKPRLVPVDMLQHSSDRLRDKKVTVRRQALKSLTEVYAHHCQRTSEGKGLHDEQFEWIPGRLIKCYYDKDLRLDTTQVFLDEELFPAKLPVAERAKHWVALFAAFDETSLKAFAVLLILKQRLQQELQAYLELRRQQKDDQSADLQDQVNATLVRILGLSVDPTKGMEHLQKLHQIKDNNLFKLLGNLLNHNTTVAEAKNLREDLLKRLGDKHPQRDFMKMLASRASYTIFGKEHVQAMLTSIKSGEFTADRKLLSAAMALLVEIAEHFPKLLEQAEQDIFGLLKEDDEILKGGAAHILAKAGGYMGELGNEVESHVESVLMKLCMEGTRKQAKHSVSAIAALSGEFSLKTMSLLYDRLLNALFRVKDDSRLPTVCQSLGCIAQWSMPVFETRENDIIRFVVRELLRRNSSQKRKKNDWDNPSQECCQKMFGLKMLVKSFLPLRDCPPRSKVTGLMSVLAKLLECGEISLEVYSSDVDKAHLRLTAAKGVLRLAKRYDAQVSPRLFQLTVLTVQDPFFPVRKEFTLKIHNMLHDRALPHKFACAFALAVVDVDKDNVIDASGRRRVEVAEAKKHLNDFVDNCRREARLRLALLSEKSAGTTLKMHPEYVLVYLLHVLAHHPDFPNMDGEREKATSYDPFQKQLAFFLRALLHSDGDGKLELMKKGDDTDNLPAIAAIFRTIKDMEDASPAPKSENLYILCDIGLQIMRELGLKKLWNTDAFPGEIPLPASLYRPIEAAEGEEAPPRKVDGSHFPKCLLEPEGGTKGKAARLGGSAGKAVPQNVYSARKKKEKPESGDGEPMEKDAHGEPLQKDAHGELRKKDAHGEPRKKDAHGEPRKKDAHGEPLKKDAHGREDVEAEEPLMKRARHVEKHDERAAGDKEAGEKRSGVDATDVVVGAGEKSAKTVKRKTTEPSTPGATNGVSVWGKDEAEDEGGKRKRDSSQFQPEKKATPTVKSPMTPITTKEYGEELVGLRIKVWWPQDRQYYEGKVQSFNRGSRKHLVEYDDGERENLRMEKQKFKIVDGDPGRLLHRQNVQKNGQSSRVVGSSSDDTSTPTAASAKITQTTNTSRIKDSTNAARDEASAPVKKILARTNKPPALGAGSPTSKTAKERNESQSVKIRTKQKVVEKRDDAERLKDTAAADRSDRTKKTAAEQEAGTFSHRAGDTVGENAATSEIPEENARIGADVGRLDVGKETCLLDGRENMDIENASAKKAKNAFSRNLDQVSGTEKGKEKVDHEGQGPEGEKTAEEVNDSMEEDEVGDRSNTSELKEKNSKESSAAEDPTKCAATDVGENKVLSEEATNVVVRVEGAERTGIEGASVSPIGVRETEEGAGSGQEGAGSGQEGGLEASGSRKAVDLPVQETGEDGAKLKDVVEEDAGCRANKIKVEGDEEGTRSLARNQGDEKVEESVLPMEVTKSGEQGGTGNGGRKAAESIQRQPSDLSAAASTGMQSDPVEARAALPPKSLITPKTLLNGKGGTNRRVSRGIPTPQYEPPLNGEFPKGEPDIAPPEEEDDDESDEDMDLVQRDTVEGSTGEGAESSKKRDVEESKAVRKGGSGDTKGRGMGGKNGGKESRGKPGRGGGGGKGGREGRDGDDGSRDERAHQEEIREKVSSAGKGDDESAKDMGDEARESDDMMNEDAPLEIVRARKRRPV